MPIETIPTSITLGDSLRIEVEIADYPASAGWVLKFRMVPRSAGTAVELTATADGSTHVIAATAAVSSAWGAGPHAWYAWVEKASEVVTVGEGALTLKPNPRSLAAGTDTRSAAEVALAAINATLAGKATSATASYKINGRELQSYSVAELLKLRQTFERDVRAEQVAAGLVPRGNTIRMRFAR